MASPHDNDCRILSLVTVQAKGRPPFKQKVSRIDAAVRRKESVRKKALSTESICYSIKDNRGIAHQRYGLVGDTRKYG